MAKLTYISSGIPYQRLAFKEVVENQECTEWIRKTYTSMQKNPDHNYGLMFNAFVEKNFGPVVHDTFGDVLADIHADSGGLQIVTRGLKFDAAMKQEIFETQGKYAHSAMSFDEIPVGVIGNKSVRNDLTNRYFDRERFEWCARQSGRNVAEQIKTFIANDSPAKSIFIVQGNCYDTYMKWVEYALEEIPEELRYKVGGVAMGAAALGEGLLENIKRGFFYTQIQQINPEANHMHLLGVGSVTKLMPHIAFIQSGLYKDVHLTYDSTTHTSGIHMGRYYINRKNLEFPKHFDRPKWETIYNDMCSKFEINFTLEEFHWLLNSRSDPVREKYGDRSIMIQSNITGILGQILNFQEHVNHCLVKKKNLISFANSNKLGNVVKTLHEIKTKEDYDHWVRNVGRSVPSKPVMSRKKSTLEGFFDVA